MNLNGPLTNLKWISTGAPSSVDSSHIYLPTSDSKESSFVDYIEFIQFGTLMEDSLFADKSTNIVVNMKLTANPACKIDVILDEETGDIIKGEGSGVLDIKVGNKEPLTMRGDEITSGDYTFNFQTFLKNHLSSTRAALPGMEVHRCHYRPESKLHCRELISAALTHFNTAPPVRL